MGYGHLRPAYALAERLGVPVREVDRTPFASPTDRLIWRLSRRLYETISRRSQGGVARRVAGPILEAITCLPTLDQAPSPVPADADARWLHRLMRLGFGRQLVRSLRASRGTLVTTFYAPAIMADAHGIRPVISVVTDSEVSRIWVPVQPERYSIQYCVPHRRTARRLAAYGVPGTSIHLTGFPLPPTLTGDRAGTDAQRRFARLERWAAGDGPLHLCLAIGGAGAQADLALNLVRALAHEIRRGDLRVTLVTGTNTSLSVRFRRRLEHLGVGNDGPDSRVSVLSAERHTDYLERFNEELPTTDLLWTKPSELSFFAALGLPMLLAPAVGEHERANATILFEAGAAFPVPAATELPHWLAARRRDGALERAARAGFASLPRDATDRVAAVVEHLHKL